jgi:pyruvate/2-oxoglutarate dehydrogenase complex dihydrolipoamide dehydrogenase (E3) component
MYEQDASEKGIPLDTYTIPLHENDRAVADGQEEGFVRIHVRKGTDRIIGATIVAAHAGELISQLSLAMVGKLGLGTILNTIYPYPTQSEAIKRAAGVYARTRLTPFVKKLFDRWLAFIR